MSRPGPANYTANVNRAKTKKWVEAKSYSYDGDDWGDVDDYDEYGGYDEQEPAPASKPTGLRQRGQSASQTPQEVFEGRQDFYQSPVDGRPQQAGVSGNPRQQQHYGSRSFTSSQNQNQPAMMRSNSFDREDEQRAFSANYPQQHGSNEHYTSLPPQSQSTRTQDFQPVEQERMALDQPQAASSGPPLSLQDRPSLEGLARYGEHRRSPGGNSRTGPAMDQSRQTNLGSRTKSITSQSSAEFHPRRDFSPSAMPQPLSARGSPSSHSPDRNPAARPPRKSSLGQHGSPTQPTPVSNSAILTARDQEDNSSQIRDRSGSGTAKALPFVRPADIYKRMQEEKERERQSQDSSRPSMDAILGGPNDRPTMGRSQDSESSLRLKPSLDPVKERKSEYGMEGLNLQDEQTRGEPRSTSSKTFEFPKRTSNIGTQQPKSSLMPILPDVSRISGFGESFFGTTKGAEEGSQDSIPDFSNPSPTQPSQPNEEFHPERNLQHQPSLGFTSAVHQAFDKAEDQVPPTPSSTQGSSIGRSTSGGTSTVSPIISRGPSTATENWNSRLPGIDSVSTPMIPEGPEESSPRPLSSESLGTPTQVARKPSPVAETSHSEIEEPPPSFIPGYRRNSDTPSPDNSPRRTPALETTRQLRRPQEVEIAAATPTDPSFSTDGSSQASATSTMPQNGEQPVDAISNDSHGSAANTQFGPGNSAGNGDMPFSPISPLPVSPFHDRLRDRTDSSGSNKVRNLADKIENQSRPGSAHSSTPRASVLGPGTQRKDEPVSARPLVDRIESFRPQLPGGWESSASIAPAATLSTPKAAEAPHQIESSNTRTPENTNAVKEVKDDGTSSARKPPSAVEQIKDTSEDAFAAAAAAGSALAGAFGSAFGTEGTNAQQAQSTKRSSKERSPETRYDAKDVSTRDYGSLHPEASKPHMTSFNDEESSTAAPTPLPKDHPQDSTTDSNEPDYFPSNPTHGDVENMAASVDDKRPLKAMKPPPALPLLSTDTTQQYESDRLRKEIVRELTPMSGSESTTAETDFSNYQQTPSNASVSRLGHESGVLPKEYESYWNDGVSDDGVVDLDASPAQSTDASATAGVIQPLQPNQRRESVPPISVPQEISREKSPRLEHRFSWEQPLHDLSPEAEPGHGQPGAPYPTSFNKSVVYPDSNFQTHDDRVRTDRSPASGTDQKSGGIDSPIDSRKDIMIQGDNDLSTLERKDTDMDKKLPEEPSGLEPVTSSTRLNPDSPLRIREGDLDESQRIQKDPHHPGSGYEVRQLDSPIQHSSNTPEQTLGLPPPADAPPKITGFREILALKSPAERIRGYNDTREQFANLNTGLGHWLASTMNDLPEHADLLSTSGRVHPNLQSHKSSASRSKLAGLLPSGGHPGQQPYFQQYLNASSQPAGADGNTPGSGTNGSPVQGFSPSGGSSGKLSSQQVQAKGKDFLHTAGVFGGKANVAAKGLFSKGKSKLRAASGTEKAFPRQPSNAEASSRGIRRPATESQATSAVEDTFNSRTDPHKTVNQAAPSEPSYLSCSAPSKNLRGIPSVESFTPSQYGDDERSEESEPTARQHPARASSLYPSKGSSDLEGSHFMQDGMTAKVHQEAPSADVDADSPREIQTPRSLNSSNQTPTQATFARGNLTTALVSTSNPTGTHFPQRDEYGQVEENKHGGNYHDSYSLLQSQTPSQVLHSTNDAVSMPANQKHCTGDSRSTICNVSNEEVTGCSPRASLQSSDQQASVTPRRSSLGVAIAISSSTSDTQHGSRNQRKPEVISPPRESLIVPRLSQDYPTRGPSIDSLPVHLDLDRPPSPVSPYQLNFRRTTESRGRTGPIHYGLDHDFIPNVNRDKNDSHGSSGTRTPRRSSVHDRPNFQNEDEIPPSSYAGQISRDQSPMVRQQAPEYKIEGTSSQPEWPSENQTRSRRGSRSSAFFKSLSIGSTTRVDEPPLPNSLDNQPSSLPMNPPTQEKRTSKRSSIFRSLAGTPVSSSASGPSKENVYPEPPTSNNLHYVHPRIPPAPPHAVEDDEFPSRGNSRNAASRLSKKLQRASTTSNIAQEGGRKKRFSGIGSLFGRGTRKTQDSSDQTPNVAPKQESTATGFSHSAASTPQGQENWYKPPKDNYTPAPPGGYYAPRPAQIDDAPSSFGQHSYRNIEPSPWRADAPAYVQDMTLRQQRDQQTSTSPYLQYSTGPRPSATFPQSSRPPSSTSIPRSSTGHDSMRPTSSQRTVEESRGSGSVWTRFSSHGHLKSRVGHSRTSSHISQQQSNQDTLYSSDKSPKNSKHQSHSRNHTSSRSDSPPPPPPPPKDEWNQPLPRESTPISQVSQRETNNVPPSQVSTCPIPNQYRLSLPPLQTSVGKQQRSIVGSDKTLTPEEKRKSRQQEIENSTLSPRSPVNRELQPMPGRFGDEEEESVVMSATSFPGQEWQPEHAYWVGD